MYEYAKELGVEFHLGVFVDEYFEREDAAGIIIQGERVEADLLIAAVSPCNRLSRMG
jgi:NADPH-dependent 2,4-dienoyl-CoA reductase/sulfur reductase-like enzyme